MTKDLFEKMSTNWQNMAIAFETYCKSRGLDSQNHLWIVALLLEDAKYTQKEITELMHISKQLTNAIIKQFWQQGYVELKERSDDRRQKEISLTTSGKVWAKGIIEPFNEAITSAAARFESTELATFMELLERYDVALSEELGERS